LFGAWLRSDRVQAEAAPSANANTTPADKGGRLGKSWGRHICPGCWDRHAKIPLAACSALSWGKAGL